MSSVRVGKTACFGHDGADCNVANKLIGTGVFVKNTKGLFLCWNAKILCAAENRNNRINRIEDRASQILELADNKVLFQFVISKSDRHCSDLGLGMVGRNVLVVGNNVHGIAVEGEVFGYESKGASCTFTGVDGCWNSIKADSFFQM
jgi:hypothetical protein